MTTSSSSSLAIPTSCDYLIVGAGATAMAFVDSFIQGLASEQQQQAKSANGNNKLSIVMIDPHSTPGGQWNDSYSFVRLHQPSAMYGVESTNLEPSSSSSSSSSAADEKEHRATRQEILDYYAKLVKKWEESSSSDNEIFPVKLRFVGNAWLEFPFQPSTTAGTADQSKDGPLKYRIQIQNSASQPKTEYLISVTKRLVDARYLQPDLPVSTPPKFQFDPAKIRCVPVNDIIMPDNSQSNSNTSTTSKYYVVIGAGKTGMDAVVYLLTQLKIPKSNIMWIAPHDPWITARENIGNCMEFLHDATQIFAKNATSTKQQSQLLDELTSTAVVQQTFLQWEEQGKIYRLFPSDTTNVESSSLPTKFNDATLCKEELELLRSLPPNQIVRGQGRVASIDSETGDLVFEDGNKVSLPWVSDQESSLSAQLENTVYVHCSAGAFHYTKLNGLPPSPVFDPELKRITIQDVYGTPGFCFVGSILGKLESLSYAANPTFMDDAHKNALCRVPPPPPSTNSQGLGPSGGTVVGLSKEHGFVQRLCNVRNWLQTPPLREWLVGHRLFNLGHYASAEEMDQLVKETWAVLKENGLVDDE